MRHLTPLLFVLAACTNSDKTGQMCTQDSQCGKDVCANDETCLPQSDVELVRVTWTVGGQPANATICANLPQLSLAFQDGYAGDTFWFVPVPCAEGVFTATKLPNNYDSVEMQDSGMTTNYGGGPITNGSASFDLIVPVPRQ